MSGLRRRALPERELAAVSLRAVLFDRPLQAPLIVASAHAAAEHGLALLTGAAPSARPPLVIAELDPAQARGRDGLWRAAERLEELDADALAIRLDPLEEPLRAEEIAAIVGHVSPRPVMARRATDFEDVVMLHAAGVAAVEVTADEGLIADARAAAPGLPLIVSSGLRDGDDTAWCLALGATACVVEGAPGEVIEQLRKATWLSGAGSIHELGREHLR